MREFLQHRDVLFAYLLALTRDYHAAEEAFQDLGMSVVSEARRGVRPANFPAWARALARNRAADYFRKQTRRRESEQGFQRMAEMVDRAFEENPLSEDDSHERLRYLRECLKGLGRRARQIVDLRYKEHKSLREIALAVSWKEDSVKVALAKARRALADCVSRKLRGAT
jgi:RNA polymerase sigma-70 factor (ECF subfamily)